jgi:four helix bundle protein
MANIAEGFERKNSKEFAYFLRIARGSCAEVQSHLYVALDADLIAAEGFSELQDQASKTGRRISAFQRYLSQPPD